MSQPHVIERDQVGSTTEGKKRSDEQPVLVPVEKLGAGAKTVIAAIGLACVATIQFVTLRSDLSANNKDLKVLSDKVVEIEKSLKSFDRLSQLQFDIIDLRKNGSDGLKTTEEKLQKLTHDFELHIATTTSRTGNAP